MPGWLGQPTLGCECAGWRGRRFRPGEPTLALPCSGAGCAEGRRPPRVRGGPRELALQRHPAALAHPLSLLTPPQATAPTVLVLSCLWGPERSLLVILTCLLERCCPGPAGGASGRTLATLAAAAGDGQTP